MVVAQKMPAVLHTLPVSTQQQYEPANAIDFFPGGFSSNEEPPEEIYEPTADDQLFVDEVLSEQYEQEFAEERLELQAYEDEMKELDDRSRAECILEYAGDVLAGIKYSYFVSRSKGRYRSGKRSGQQIPRRNWVEVELVSRGVEPNKFIGKGFRHRVYWSADKFPWDECADEKGVSEPDFRELVPTLTQNLKRAKKYLDGGVKPDYGRSGLVSY